MNLENYFISQFNNSHIGDDGAIVEKVDSMVLSKDAFFENVHFRRSWMSYYQIAKKAMIINISDAVAMNAKPKYILLSVAMPKDITKTQMRDLVRGFEEVASEYGAIIVGGDTISNIKLDITVTVISSAARPLRRVGLRNNHMIAHTGILGRSAKELKKLFNLGRIHKYSKFIDIKLNAKFISNASRVLSSGMDISDGLFSDLDKLARVNAVGFKFIKNIDKSIACSGEEYEMLIGFDKRNRKSVLRRAEQSRTKLNIFATTARTKYINRCKSHHF